MSTVCEIPRLHLIRVRLNSVTVDAVRIVEITNAKIG